MRAAVLQWGRVLMNAEGERMESAVFPPAVASMGPRSYERGREIGFLVTSSASMMLQWGRVLMNAEGALTQDLEYQQLNSKIASAFRIF
jgi:hypothetical protein